VKLAADRLFFHGLVLSPDGTQSFEIFVEGLPNQPEAIGEQAARDLLARMPPGLFAS
jgi:porphobilinogen deaminase